MSRFTALFKSRQIYSVSLFIFCQLYLLCRFWALEIKWYLITGRFMYVNPFALILELVRNIVLFAVTCIYSVIYQLDKQFNLLQFWNLQCYLLSFGLKVLFAVSWIYSVTYLLSVEFTGWFAVSWIYSVICCQLDLQCYLLSVGFTVPFVDCFHPFFLISLAALYAASHKVGRFIHIYPQSVPRQLIVKSEDLIHPPILY